MTTPPIYQPTFVLKKVDPIRVSQLYSQQFYKTVTLPSKKLTVEAAIVPSITGGTQSFRDKNKCLIVIHTTNNEMIKSLPTYKPRCFWCMQDLNKNAALHVPIPTGMNMAKSLEDDLTMYVFDTNMGGKGGGSCCSFECALAYIRNFNNGVGTSMRSYSKETLEVFLKTLYRLCYPEKGDLRQAPDFRLLNQYGGTMTVEEFVNSKSEFIHLSNVAIHSVSDQYMTGTTPK